MASTWDVSRCHHHGDWRSHGHQLAGWCQREGSEFRPSGTSERPGPSSSCSSSPSSAWPGSPSRRAPLGMIGEPAQGWRCPTAWPRPWLEPRPRPSGRRHRARRRSRHGRPRSHGHLSRPCPQPRRPRPRSRPRPRRARPGRRRSVRRASSWVPSISSSHLSRASSPLSWVSSTIGCGSGTVWAATTRCRRPAAVKGTEPTQSGFAISPAAAG